MQEMAPSNVLMLWAELLPPLYMISILDVEFFLKWLTVLPRWLSNEIMVSEWLGVGQGLRQGYILAPMVFNIFFTAALNIVEERF